MIHCNCSEVAFTYTLFCKENEKYIQYTISKCNKLKTDKKKPCNYYKCEFLSEKEITSKTETKIQTKIENNTSEKFKEDLNNCIKLVKLCRQKKLNENNYIARINYYLKIFNYKLFFTETESLDELETRITFPPDDVKPHKKNEKIVLLDIPDNLKVKNVVFNNHKKFNVKCKNYSNYPTIYKVKRYHSRNEIENEDEDEDEQINEDEDGFDMENNYSDCEEDNDEISGYFSD